MPTRMIRLRAPRLAVQADARAGVRHHQIGDGIPPIPAARARLRPRRVEPRHYGLEHQADVRAQARLSATSAPLDRAATVAT
jgi:hypothetical protein